MKIMLGRDLIRVNVLLRKVIRFLRKKTRSKISQLCYYQTAASLFGSISAKLKLLTKILNMSTVCFYFYEVASTTRHELLIQKQNRTITLFIYPHYCG